MLRAGLLFFTQSVIFVFLVGPVFAALVFWFPENLWDKKAFFLDRYSFFILAAVFLILGMGNGLKDFFAGYERARKQCTDTTDIKKSLAAIIALRKMVINWMPLGFLIGAVIMFANLDDMASICRGYSAATISIYYGVAVCCCFLPPNGDAPEAATGGAEKGLMPSDALII